MISHGGQGWLYDYENAYMKTIWLVVWLPFLAFSHIFGIIIIPIDELIFFRGVALAHQPVIYLIILHLYIGLSRNGGYPKWIVFDGMIFGGTPHFRKPPPYG